MDKGYIENGFIVDLTNAKKTSEIIYELSRILDMPESKGKCICLKLGSVNLTQEELTSIKVQIELMDSQLAFISTSSTETLESATALNIKISEFTNAVEAPTFEEKAEESIDEKVETESNTAEEENEESEITEENSAEDEEEIINNENKPTEEVSNALDNIFKEHSSKFEKLTETISVVHKTEQPLEKKNTDEKEIAPVVHHNEEIAKKVEAQEIKEENDEEVASKKCEPEKLPTLYLRKTIRSGQSISSDGNLIVIGDVNPGAEVIAKGDITVWGILGGIAHAGSDNNNYARIRALKLNPVQIRIGEIFARRPDTVNIPYVQKSSEYTPEEAFTYKGSIVIRKIHEEN